MSTGKKREFLQLAHTWKADKYDITGWWMSEKLDGMRCMWDGGATRGVPKINVPWANHKGDSRYVTPPVCTGLWSRYGNVIHASDEWLDQLPLMPLDGELYLPGFRQNLMKIVKSITPCTQAWQDVRYHTFDCPPFETILKDGRIYNPNYSKVFDDEYMPDTEGMVYVPRPATSYRKRYEKLGEFEGGVVERVEQIQLPHNPSAVADAIDTKLTEVLAAGGEGLILRNPDTWYRVERVHSMLKIKPVDDAEGTIIGYTSGRKTDLGSKHLGKMGAMILRLDDGQVMELSGFTDQEREFEDRACENWAASYPGVEMPEWIESLMFKRGQVITFKYRGKTADGIPAEARYFRKRDRI